MKDKLLAKIKETFDDYNIEFWLDSGALLGAIRNGKFIEWDHDIDVGAWKEDLERIKKACTANGFSVHYDKNYDGNFMTVTGNVGSSFGIFFFDKNSKESKFKFVYSTNKVGAVCDYILWCLKLRHAGQKQSPLPLSFIEASVNTCKLIPEAIREKAIYVLQIVYTKIGGITVKTILPNHFFRKFTFIKFYDMDIRVPFDYRHYLAFRYGDDWMVPKTIKHTRPGVWLEKSGAKVERFKGSKRI